MDSDELGPPADTGLGLLRKINKAPHRLLNAFLRQGWAVAMTDYEGLGTYGNHPYLLGDSEGRGILDIVPAARQLAKKEKLVEQPVPGKYAIVGHSQGGQAALFGAHLAAFGPRDADTGPDTYADAGTLVGVGALAPASNLKGNLSLNPPDTGLPGAYILPTPQEELAGFYVLFSNGVFAGDRDFAPEQEKAKIFQDAALRQYLEDYDDKARVEMSAEKSFWSTTAPFKLGEPGSCIFKAQTGSAWTKYWAQVDKFNPDLHISVPIRISQADGDTRVKASKTKILIGQLRGKNREERILPVFYPGKPGQDGYTGHTVEVPEDEVATFPYSELKDHFVLLIDDTEIANLVGWVRGLL